MKREFKDLIRFEQYECLNSEIKGGYDKAHAVKCVNGTFVGTEEHGVVSWLGIPYAKPPVGGRRFKAPEYVDASERVFEAKYYGKGAFGSLGYPDCIQKLMSEDCLYLNIWLNADDKSVKKPVMVWIHGGAYVVGSGSQASYSGANPDNVTIFGQSAGGGSVSILPVMKEANRYFQKVIAQSGSTTLAFPVGCESAQGKTKALLEYTGCKTMDEIMALSEEELQKAYLEAVGQFTSCPYYGTEVLPEAPIELYRKGYAKHISIMAGSTADEMRLFMGEGPMLSIEEQKLYAQRAAGDAVPYLKEEDKKYYEEFKRVCRFQEPGLVETEFINELMFRVPMLLQLDVQSAFNKTFSYYWSYPSSNADLGAAHSVELMFVFNMRGFGTSSAFNGTNNSDEIFTAVMQMWTNFARCGNPSTDKVEWKAYSADDQNVLDIAGPGPVHRQVLYPSLPFRYHRRARVIGTREADVAKGQGGLRPVK